MIHKFRHSKFDFYSLLISLSLCFISISWKSVYVNRFPIFRKILELYSLRNIFGFSFLNIILELGIKSDMVYLLSISNYSKTATGYVLASAKPRLYAIHVNIIFESFLTFSSFLTTRTTTRDDMHNNPPSACGMLFASWGLDFGGHFWLRYGLHVWKMHP